MTRRTSNPTPSTEMRRSSSRSKQRETSPASSCVLFLPNSQHGLTPLSLGPRRSFRPQHDQGENRCSMRVRLPSSAAPHLGTLTCSLRSHATLACYKSLLRSNPAVRSFSFSSLTSPSLTLPVSRSFFSTGSALGPSLSLLPCPSCLLLTALFLFSQAKIAVKCESEEDLQLLEASAKSLGLCARSIQDAYVLVPFLPLWPVALTSFLYSGRTQVDPGTTTVLGAFFCLSSVDPLLTSDHLQASDQLLFASSTRSPATSACCKSPSFLLQQRSSPPPSPRC